MSGIVIDELTAGTFRDSLSFLGGRLRLKRMFNSLLFFFVSLDIWWLGER